MTFAEKKAKELTELVNLGLINKNEARDILKFNISALNKLYSPNKCREDFMRLVHFEIKLGESLRSKNEKVWNRMILPSLCRLMNLGAQNFAKDIKVLCFALQFYEAHSLKKHFLKLSTSALASIPDSFELIEVYTRFQAKVLGDVMSARKLLMLKIRDFPNDINCWVLLLQIEYLVAENDIRLFQHVYDKSCVTFGRCEINSRLEKIGVNISRFQIE